MPSRTGQQGNFRPIDISDGGTAATNVADARLNLEIYENLPSTALIEYIGNASDLPAAVGGVRTLVSGTIYVFVANVDLGTDRLSCTGDCYLVSLAQYAVTLSTSNASALLTATGEVRIIEITVANDLGPCLDVTINANMRCGLINAAFQNAATDTITGSATAIVCLISGGSWSGSANEGVEISGTWIGIICVDVGFLQGGATAILAEVASGATVTNITFSNCEFLTTAAGQTGLHIDSGIVPANRAKVIGCTFTGPGSPVNGGGANQTTIGYAFRTNPGIEDSASVGDIDFKENTTATTIATVNTATVIATGSPWVLDANSERASLSAPSLVYDGVEDIRALVTFSGHLEGASNNRDFQLRLFHNGGQVDYVTISYKTNPVGGTHSKILSLSQGDTLEVRVSNQTNATNVTVLDAQLGFVKAG